MSIEFVDIPPPEFVGDDESARELLRLSLRKIEEDPEDFIGWDTETHGKKMPIKKKPLDPLNDTVTYWSLSFKLGETYRRWCISQEYFLYFSPLLESPRLNIAGWNLKYDAHIAWNCGVNIWNARQPVDGLVLAILLDENRRSHGLKSCAEDWCGLHMTKYTSLFDGIVDAEGKKAREYETSLVELVELGHEDLVSNYASYDAYAHLRAVEWLIERLSAIPLGPDGNLWEYFLAMELPFTEMLWRMERRGMHVDTKYLKSRIPIITKRINDLEREICREANYPININSPAQLAKFFFTKDGLGLKPVKLTATQKPSTDEEVMKHLVNAGVEVAKLVVDCRKLHKTKSTYLDALIAMSDHFEDGRIHPSFNQMGARCMPAGELVLTNRGYLPVEDVKVGDKVLTHEGRSRRVLEVHDNGLQPVVETTLNNGLSLKTTENHGYHTPHDWVLPVDLLPGQEVVVHSGKEEWAAIKEWKDFEVSSWGRVRNRTTGRFRKLQPKGKWGHLKVNLYRNGAQTRKGGDLKDFPVHRLVADTFVPNPDGLPETRHLNGYAWDNTAQNLVWGTSKDNRQDAVKHGSMCLRNSERAKLTEEAVEETRSTPFVRGFRRDGYKSRLGSDRTLAQKFGVSREMIKDVRLGNRWQPLPSLGKVASFHLAKVVSVQSIGVMQTYGITVEEDHSHVPGGIITHNTGRLSTENPNSQNFPRPKQDEWGIRRAFTAPPGKKLVVADYEQIEMRIMADFSGDERMINAINEGKDLHSFTVAFTTPGVKYEDVVTAKKAGDKADDRQSWLQLQRQAKKAVGFGIVYGAGPPKISTSIEITEEEWQAKIDEMPQKTFEYRVTRLMKNNPLLTEEQAIEQVGKHSVAGDKIQEYFDAFPGVKGFIDQTPVICRHRMYHDEKNQPRKWDFKVRSPGAKPTSWSGHSQPFGYVQTLCGRYRRLTDIDHKNYFYRSEAERMAVNTRVQGSASDITKAAMLRIEYDPRLQSLGVLVLNQAHDEIIMEVPEENAEEAAPIVKQCMEHPFGDGPDDDALQVPIPIDLHIVGDWSKAK